MWHGAFSTVIVFVTQYSSRQLETALITVLNCIIKIRYSGACDNFCQDTLPEDSRLFCSLLCYLSYIGFWPAQCDFLRTTVQNFEKFRYANFFCAGKNSFCKIGLHTQAVQKFVFYKPLSILAFSHNELLSLSSFV